MKEIYINSNNEFSLRNFLDNQYDIFKKFIPPTCNGTCLERFDKLLINLAEEVVEYKEAYNDAGLEELKDELTDVIMYTGTLVMCWYDDYKDEIDKIIDEYDKSVSYKQMALERLLFNDMTKHIFDNIQVRRNFSERKWHKPHNNEDNTPDVIKLVKMNLNYIFIYLSQLKHLDFSHQRACERIFKKEEFIMNL